MPDIIILMVRGQSKICFITYIHYYNYDMINVEWVYEKYVLELFVGHFHIVPDIIILMVRGQSKICFITYIHYYNYDMINVEWVYEKFLGKRLGLK